MKEQDYIDTGDKQKLDDAYRILTDIVPEMSSYIGLKEYYNMMSTINKLRAEFKIEIEE
jgi:hypothetical protein